MIYLVTLHSSTFLLLFIKAYSSTPNNSPAMRAFFRKVNYVTQIKRRNCSAKGSQPSKATSGTTRPSHSRLQGGAADFVSVPVGDEAKRADAEKLLRKASRAMKRVFENAADSMMMKISIDILKNK